MKKIELKFWNDWASLKSNLKFFVCGSATTWMLSKFIGDKGGIYGRVCRSLWLAPFTLKETEQFLKDIKGVELNRYQLTKAYMILGGIPYYLDMLAKDIPLDITTYGLAHNLHSGIVQSEVMIDDLFA